MDIIYLEDAETRHPELFKILGSANVLVVVNSREGLDEKTLKKLQQEVRRLIQDIDSLGGDVVAVVDNRSRPRGKVRGTIHP